MLSRHVVPSVLHEMMSKLWRGLCVEMLDLLLPQLCEDNQVTAMVCCTAVRGSGARGVTRAHFAGRSRAPPVAGREALGV